MLLTQKMQFELLAKMYEKQTGEEVSEYHLLKDVEKRSAETAKFLNNDKLNLKV